MEYDLVLVPSCLKELQNIIRTKVYNYIVITDDLKTILYCQKNSIKFLEFNQCIDIEKYKNIDVDTFLNQKNFNIKCRTQKKYFYIFKYNFGHLIRLIELSNLLFEGINKKLSFKKIYFFKYNYKIPYGRSSLNGVLQLLLSLKFKKKLLKPSFSLMTLMLFTSLMFIVNFFSELFFFIEFIVKKIFKNNPTLDLNKIKKDKVLFFSGGRDFVFHSILSKKLSFFHLINIKGDSIYDTDAENQFDIIINLQSSLLNGFFNNEIKNSYNKSLLNELLNDHFSSKLLKLYFINYYAFRIKRDFKIINSLKTIINKISPKIIFSSSLSLPLITASHLNIKSVSEFEGFGIEQNPMAPYIGDYVSIPGHFSEMQFKKYKAGDGVIFKNGAYYL